MKFLPYLLVLSVLAAGQSAKNPTQTTIANRAEVHSRLFSNGGQNQIDEALTATPTGDVFLRTFEAPPYVIELPLPDELAMLASESDLVVLATAGEQISHPTADRGFIYSDWAFAVKEVLKDNPKARVLAGSTVTVTRPGGTIEANGRKVHAKLPDFPEFNSGRNYLLYLRYVPATGAYAMGSARAFGFGFTSGKHTVQPDSNPRLQERLQSTTRDGLLETARATAHRAEMK